MQKNRKTLLLLVIFFLSIALVAISRDSLENLTIKDLAIQTTKTASSIVTYKASFIYTKLEKGLKDIKSLKSLIDEKKEGKTSVSTSTLIKKAQDVFKSLYEEYTEIDENSTSIKEGFENLILQASEESIKAEKKVQALESQRDELEEKLKSSTDPEVEESLKSQIEILQTRIKIWNNFKDAISQLPTKSKKLEENIIYFLKIVHLSVPVYYQAYMALNEIEEIRDFLADIKALSHLDILSDEIEHSWSDISEIVKSIENISQFSEQGVSSFSIGNVKILHAFFLESAIDFFRMIWNFFFHPKVYTWEDVAKIVKEMNNNLKTVIEEL
jgi:hypothetical protein